MGKTLVIAEKPSVGRDIAKSLKCTGRGDGYLFSDTHIVSWAVGHLVELCEPDEYDEKYKKWRFDVLPIIPEEIKLKAVPKTKQQLNILKKLMNDKETDSIICATDSGREGELIFRYIYKIVKCKKPFLRLWISSMTEAAINEGFSKLKDGKEYDSLYYSALCRSEADWLVGINASRAFTIKYNALLSIGRVQTPTLAIIVERQKEITSFVPQEYWEVSAFFKTIGDENYKGKWFDPKHENDTKILDKQKAVKITEKIKNCQAEIDSVEKEHKKQPPPLLYDLTELQRDANRKFGYSADKTLSLAQDLYEKRKMITYPRTDSRYLSSDMPGKMTSALKKLSMLENYKKFAERTLQQKTLPISKRIIDDSKITDHHAIIPTDGNLNTSALNPDERNIFDLIAKRFLCVFYPYYEYDVTKIVTKVQEELFLTKGSTIDVLGWMELYKDDKIYSDEKKGGADDENALLPNVKKGETVQITDASCEQKKTKPPKPYNEATLLSAMENPGRFIEDENIKEQMKDFGLGTPATRASIIERLIKVGYITRKGKALIPSEKGMKLIEIVPNELKSPETTGKWEKGLSSIAKGKMERQKFMGSISRYVNYIIEQAKQTQKSVVFPEENRRRGKSSKKLQSFGMCPICGIGGVFENTKAYYCSRWQEGCKMTIWKNTLDRYGCKLDNEMLIKLLATKKIEKVKLVYAQTNEKKIADVIINPAAYTIVEIVNAVADKSDDL